MFGSLRQPATIVVNVPLARLGGMIAVHMPGMTRNVSSAVGFITLFGVEVQNGEILVSGLTDLQKRGMPLAEAIRLEATERLRAVRLTLFVLPALYYMIEARFEARRKERDLEEWVGEVLA